MRIFTLTSHAPTPSENERLAAALQPLAASPNAVVAAKWQRLLELVNRLEADGERPELFGHFRSSPDSVEQTLWLHPAWETSGHCALRLTIDWYDRAAPKENGLPPLHFRISTHDKAGQILREARRATAPEAEQVVRCEIDHLRSE